jgi:hypothetical protein
MKASPDTSLVHTGFRCLRSGRVERNARGARERAVPPVTLVPSSS